MFCSYFVYLKNETYISMELKNHSIFFYVFDDLSLYHKVLYYFEPDLVMVRVHWLHQLLCPSLYSFTAPTDCPNWFCSSTQIEFVTKSFRNFFDVLFSVFLCFSTLIFTFRWKVEQTMKPEQKIGYKTSFYVRDLKYPHLVCYIFHERHTEQPKIWQQDLCKIQFCIIVRANWN